ncbi:MAG: hypothetical protein HOE90_18075 [Bacteriovoracaceae bacterium]|jgi:hypothetical protein|nr:hypothetical protein [Bacteriovoracaceae bacterium]
MTKKKQKKKEIKGFEDFIDHFGINLSPESVAVKQKFVSDFELHDKLEYELIRQEKLAAFFTEKLSHIESFSPTGNLIIKQRENKDLELDRLAYKLMKEGSPFLAHIKKIFLETFSGKN